MNVRSVHVSTPARLSTQSRHLVIAREGEKDARVPLEDLGVLVLDYAPTTATEPLLAACAEADVAVVVCDARHMPCGVLLPFAAHSLHAKTLREQVAVTEPTRKRLWQAIVMAKIRAQARALEDATGSDHKLAALAPFVRSGDPDNVEARAARAYFPRLFGPDFVRNRDLPGVNALLNYGYAVLRAAVARAVVGAGLHPALGLHHHNQYNPFALADDLMEPLRPLVDARAHGWVKTEGDATDTTREARQAMLAVLTADVAIDAKRYPLATGLALYAASARACLVEGARKLACPGP